MQDILTIVQADDRIGSPAGLDDVSVPDLITSKSTRDATLAILMIDALPILAAAGVLINLDVSSRADLRSDSAFGGPGHLPCMTGVRRFKIDNLCFEQNRAGIAEIPQAPFVSRAMRIADSDVEPHQARVRQQMQPCLKLQTSTLRDLTFDADR